MPEEPSRSAKKYLRNHCEYGGMLGSSDKCTGISMNIWSQLEVPGIFDNASGMLGHIQESFGMGKNALKYSAMYRNAYEKLK